MSPSPSCPSQDLLSRLLQGTLTAEELERIAGHVESCAFCTEAAAGLTVADPFSEELRGAANLALTDGANAEDLRLRLRALRGSEGPDAAEELIRSLLPANSNQLGRYRLGDRLGAGGMGVVFRADDPGLGRAVALKVLHPLLLRSAKGRERFLAEARATAAIRHDHVVTIYDVGEAGLPYFAMELLTGQPLDCLASRFPLPVREATRIGREMAAGLAAAHAQGLIHRDVKPANVWLEEPSGRVKLLDFGLVRPEQSDVHLTDQGQVVGTPAYMSPEQAAGAVVDARTDLFSLGSVLYQLCTGKLPFAGDNSLAILSALATHTPPPAAALNPAVPQRLSDLIARLLSKACSGRPSSAQAVVEELTEIESELRRPRPRRSSWRRWLVGAAAALLLAGVVVIRIRTKEGSEIEIPVPAGAQVELVERPDKPIPPPPGKSPLDALRRADIPPEELALLGDGDPARAPAELVAVLGDSRLQHFGGVSDVAFSPDGKLLASAGKDGARLWDAVTFRQVRRFGQAAVGDSERVAFSPDGKWLACTTTKPSNGFPRSSVRIAATASGEDVKVLGPFERGVSCLGFNPDGKLLAAGSTGGAVLKVWDTSSGQERYSHFEGAAPSKELFLTSVAFSPDGHWLAAGASNGVVRVREALTGTERCVLDRAKKCESVTFSPDSKYLLVAGGGQALVYDSGNWSGLPALELEKGTSRSVAAFSPDGRLLAVGGMNGDNRAAFRVWSWPDRKVLHSVQANGLGTIVTALSFHPDAKTLALGSQDGAVALWDAVAGKERTTRQWGHTGSLVGLALTADGATLVSAGNDGTVRWWEVTVSPPRPGRVLEAFRKQPRSLALSPDGRTLALGDWDARLLALPQNEELLRLPQGKYLTFVRGGAELLGMVRNDLARLDAGTRKVTHSWPLDLPQGCDLFAASADGRWVAVRDVATKKPRVFEATSGRELPAPNIQHAQAMTFSPDGKVLALVDNLVVRLWDVSAGKLLREARPTHWYPNAVAFRPDGAQLATINYQGRIHLWDATTLKSVRQINLGAATLPATRLLYSPDGRHLLVGNTNGTVCVLRLDAAPENSVQKP